ncbi:MAG: adenosyl-hopene transferase HpnH [Chloroflexota bacterium]
MKTISLEIGLRMIGHVWKNRLAGRERYPIVTMLEPLETCNLTCKGCGRIREYRESVIAKKMMLSVEKCLEVVAEADSPVVSIAGGEPLIHPQIDEIVSGILAQGRFVFLCTNGLLMERAMQKIKPHRRFSWVVHLDGMAKVHDYWVERSGTFDKALSALKLALERGYRVCTNTTLFKDSDINDLHGLFRQLTDLGVEGMMISAGYPYQTIPDQDIFIERERSMEAFRQALDPSQGFSFYNNPLYLEFLRGERDVPCRAWTNPTYTPLGWRKPCYLIADEHTDSLPELMEPSLWSQYGVGKDPRCASCTMHSGYEAGMIQEAFSSPSGFARLLGAFTRWNRKGQPRQAAPEQEPKPI